jgi:hypothetical protein
MGVGAEAVLKRSLLKDFGAKTAGGVLLVLYMSACGLVTFVGT